MGADAVRVKVIVRYRDGRLLKGYTDDFSPVKRTFHFQPVEQSADNSFENSNEPKPVIVTVSEVKALFFVRDFKGDPGYTERRGFEEIDRPAGRRVEVTFHDGEIIVGTNMGYDPKRIGFFVVPADPRGNNLRAFVVAESIKNFRFL